MLIAGVSLGHNEGDIYQHRRLEQPELHLPARGARQPGAGIGQAVRLVPGAIRHHGGRRLSALHRLSGADDGLGGCDDRARSRR